MKNSQILVCVEKVLVLRVGIVIELIQESAYHGHITNESAPQKTPIAYIEMMSLTT
jgi:hypothetical protein